MHTAKTLVLGASTNPERYSHMAIRLLRENEHAVVAIGPRPGKIEDVEIRSDLEGLSQIDTITLYLSPSNQKQYYQSVLALKPRRIIFNPGTENPEFLLICQEAGIESIEACTLVMLHTGQY